MARVGKLEVLFYIKSKLCTHKSNGDKMILSYKIELKPNKEQIKQFRLNAGVARYAYNWALEKHNNLCEQAKKEAEEQGLSKVIYPKPDAYKWQKEFVPIKNESDWLHKASKWASQEALLNLQIAFERFFKGLGKYPKRKNGRKDSFTVRVTAVGYDYIKLPKIRKVRLKRKGFATDKEVKVSYITVTREADRWVCSFYIKGKTSVSPTPQQLTNISHNEITGLDLGIKDLAISSDGQVFPNPKAYKKNQLKLEKLQRKLSRQQKGSKNRNKTKTKIQRLHRKIANIRKDCSNKLTSSVTKSGTKLLVLETLKPVNMSKNHKLAGAILDSAFGEINRQFNYKCELRGIHLVKAPQFYASSKFCSCCGKKNNELTLDVREWKCSTCGAEHDRDFNAAQNLKYFGSWMINNTEGYSGIYACGDERFQFLTEQCSSTKQEFLKDKSKFILKM